MLSPVAVAVAGGYDHTQRCAGRRTMFALRLMLAGVILSLSFPAAGACYALGGIGFSQQVLATYALLALTALQCTALGLLVSSYAASTDAAIDPSGACSGASEVAGSDSVNCCA